MKHFFKICVLLLMLGCSSDDPNETEPVLQEPIPEEPIDLPEITTLSPRFTTAAVLSGEVISDGSDETIKRGICWSLTPNPTRETASHVEEDAVSTGSYSFEINSLEDNKSYYVRAYCENAAGIVYGNVIYLSTYPYIPMVTDTSKWIIENYSPGGPPDTSPYSYVAYQYAGDVEINGITYKNYGGGVNLREDIAERKVYRNIGGVEELAIDFNYPDGAVLPNGETVVVTTIPVNGGTRRKICSYREGSGGPFLSMTILEGVGGLTRFWYQAHPMSNWASSLCSSYQDNELVYNKSIENGSGVHPCQ